MSALVLFLWGSWAAFVGPVAPPAPAPVAESSPIENPPALTGYISAYSCDPHPANRMHPCGLFRNGERPRAALHGVVAACPLEYIGQHFTIDEFGTVRCVDTPRTPWVNGMVHIDLFLNYPAAVQWGIQTRPVYLVE